MKYKHMRAGEYAVTLAYIRRDRYSINCSFGFYKPDGDTFDKRRGRSWAHLAWEKGVIFTIYQPEETQLEEAVITFFKMWVKEITSSIALLVQIQQEKYTHFPRWLEEFVLNWEWEKTEECFCSYCCDEIKYPPVYFRKEIQ